MPVEQIVEGLLTLVLKLVDRTTAKQSLDRLAVRLANAAADEAERLKFQQTQS